MFIAIKKYVILFLNILSNSELIVWNIHNLAHRCFLCSAAAAAVTLNILMQIIYHCKQW